MRAGGALHRGSSNLPLGAPDTSNYIYARQISVIVPPSRGRPDQGKTGTIKQRSVYIYVPTEMMLEEWKQAAKRYRMPLSSFLVEVVDDILHKNPEGISPKAEMEARLAKTATELASLNKENETLRSLVNKTNVEIANYRTALSTTAQPSKDEEMLRGLFRLFHDHLFWKMQDIPQAMGISIDDQEGMKRLQETLNWLRELGMIEGDFEEVRCRVGGRKRESIAAMRRAKRKCIKDGKGHPGVRKRLRAKEDDAEYGYIVRVEPP